MSEQTTDEHVVWVPLYHDEWHYYIDIKGREVSAGIEKLGLSLYIEDVHWLHTGYLYLPELTMSNHPVIVDHYNGPEYADYIRLEGDGVWPGESTEEERLRFIYEEQMRLT